MILLKLLEPLGNDFVVYYEAAKMFLQGLNPYKGLITRTFPFNYPPPSLLFLWPLAFFDFRTANILWNILSLVCVLISVWVLLKISTSYRKLPLVIVFLILSFLFTVPFFPVKFNIGNAQINHFILLFCVLGIYFYQSGKKNLSAFFLAFATGIKFAPVIFVLYFILKKDWPQVIRFVFWLLVVFALPLLFVPLSFQLDYWQKVLPLSFTLGAKDWYYNQSLWGFFARAFSSSLPIYLSTYLLTTLILFLTWWQGRKISWQRQLAAVSCLYLLIHPIALQHYFGFTIIPFILLLSRRNWLILTIAYLLLAFDIRNFAAVPRELNFVLSHDFYGVLILWICALWQEKFWQIAGIIWITAITLGYISMLICRARICF